MASNFTFRNITTYVVEPEGEPVESLPTKSSLDFSPQKAYNVDNAVTETSSNPVKSSGIWTWAKGLFTPKDPTETEADTLTDESVFQFWKGELKKITWANIKATLKTYFDTIYSTFSGSYNDLSDKPTIPSNAAQITVSDPVTPDFTPAEQGDNMQDITNKVRGLQDVGFKKIAEIEITDPIAFVDITQDLEGKDLDLKVGFDCLFSLYSDVDGIDLGHGIQVNDITGEFYRYTSTSRSWLIFGSSRYGSSGRQNLRLNGGHPSSVWTFNMLYGSSLPGTVVADNRTMVILQDIVNIEKIRVLTDGLTAGSKIVIYGA